MNSRQANFFLLLIIVVLLALLLGRREPPPAPTPAPLPTPMVRLEELRSLAELAGVEYGVVVELDNDQIPAEARQSFGAKEEILMLVYGTVKAGFDLSRLAEDDLWTDGGRVQLILPAPEILSVAIDNEYTHIVYSDPSLMVGREVNLEGETRRIADEAIRQGAIEAGILAKASDYGKLYFENYLRSLGFTEARVVVR